MKLTIGGNRIFVMIAILSSKQKGIDESLKEIKIVS